jgi:hypothetical protein
VVRFTTGLQSQTAELLNRNLLDLIEIHFIAPAIIKLRSTGRGVVRHSGGIFERAAIFQIRRDAGCPEGVIANERLDAGVARSPADHNRF